MNNKNKKYLVFGIIALTILVSAAGLTTAALASDTSASNGTAFSKIFGQKRERPQALTDAQKSEMQIKIDAVKAALTAGDYNAWVTAVKALNENSQVLEKINSSNFSRYVEVNKLQEQSNSILKDLGVEGCGMGIGMGMGRNGGHGMLGGLGLGGSGRGFNK